MLQFFSLDFDVMVDDLGAVEARSGLPVVSGVLKFGT
jgi:hypothetical protein